jgi:hypothetical protein
MGGSNLREDLLSTADGAADRRAVVALLVGLVAVIAARLIGVPQSHWELDEWLFRMGVERFAPLEHHPHPPGYPLLVGLGKAVNVLAGDPFVALVALATVSSVLLYLALAYAFRRMSGDAWTGIAGALLFSLSPAMMVHSTTPMSDPPALLFLALALAAGTWLASQPAGLGASSRRDLIAPLLFGACLSASIGCRPQYAIPLVPALVAGGFLMRSWRARAAAIGAFALVSLLWFVPLVVAAAGWRKFVDYQATQLETVAKHDAMVSRGARSWIDLGQRFLFDGWGAPAWASAIVGFALLGVVALIATRRMRAAMLLLVIGTLHLLFTLLASDPADGVRYALPTQMMVAFLAAIALAAGSRVTPWPRTALFAVVGLVAAISLRYTLPVLEARRTTPSPPVQAATWARENLPVRAVILPDPALRPHADLLMKRFRRFRQHEGLAIFWNRSHVPVWTFGHGPTEIEGAMIFEWPYSDAYARLTRNHYRVVSLAPIAPERRYREVDGIYPWERVAHRREWRWLAPEARFQIPPGRGPVEIELELSPDPPYPRTTVEFLADGVPAGAVSVERGGLATACVPVPESGAMLTLRSSDSFVPAEHGGGRDLRRLAVKLLDLRRRADLESESLDATDPSGGCAAERRAA